MAGRQRLRLAGGRHAGPVARQGAGRAAAPGDHRRRALVRGERDARTARCGQHVRPGRAARTGPPAARCGGGRRVPCRGAPEPRVGGAHRTAASAAEQVAHAGPAGRHGASAGPAGGAEGVPAVLRACHAHQRTRPVHSGDTDAGARWHRGCLAVSGGRPVAGRGDAGGTGPPVGAVHPFLPPGAGRAGGRRARRVPEYTSSRASHSGLRRFECRRSSSWRGARRPRRARSR